MQLAFDHLTSSYVIFTSWITSLWEFRSAQKKNARAAWLNPRFEAGEHDSLGIQPYFLKGSGTGVFYLLCCSEDDNRTFSDSGRGSIGTWKVMISGIRSQPMLCFFHTEAPWRTMRRRDARNPDDVLWKILGKKWMAGNSFGERNKLEHVFCLTGWPSWLSSCALHWIWTNDGRDLLFFKASKC